MNYRDINYETIEDRNLDKMRVKPENSHANCHHSFVITKVVEQPHYFSYYFGIIHLRCEHCGLKKKFKANKQTILFYNKGDRWSGAKEKLPALLFS